MMEHLREAGKRRIVLGDAGLGVVAAAHVVIKNCQSDACSKSSSACELAEEAPAGLAGSHVGCLARVQNSSSAPYTRPTSTLSRGLTRPGDRRLLPTTLQGGSSSLVGGGLGAQ